MTGVNVKAQRRPIFDKAEDLDKHTKYRQINGCTRRLPTYPFARKQTSVVQGQDKMICVKILMIGLIRYAKPV